MTANTDTKSDYFWIYVACATLALVGIIGLVKLAENDKYDPIRKQLQEDAAKMNIRILKTDQ